MKNLDTSDQSPHLETGFSALACIEFDSVGFGYRVLAELTSVAALTGKHLPMQILEASPAGRNFVIFLLGQSALLKNLLHVVRTRLDEAGASSDTWLDVEVIDKANPVVTDALYQLAEVPLEETLLVVECKTMSALLSAAHDLVSGFQLKVIELKMLRSMGGGYGFFTGSSSDCANAAELTRQKLKAALREGRVELINSPPPAFREFFNFSGLPL